VHKKPAPQETNGKYIRLTGVFFSDQANSFGLRLSWLRMQAAEEEYFA